MVELRCPLVQCDMRFAQCDGPRNQLVRREWPLPGVTGRSRNHRQSSQLEGTSRTRHMHGVRDQGDAADLLRQGGFSLDESRSAVYLPRTKGLPKNTEVEVTLTFTSGEPAGPEV